ncbi:capsular biosynthesis protein [Pandoraea faecigallinarum]|uniref:NAD-dependent epimerase/dehydratase family protein n=1 Tax=Pandoraea faecigallinarum TaxID=656179 RepID=UPI0007E52542|nr:NAD(P)-dependent oxidoreductase [Pandoraea faecigallinarum]AOX47834.1 capsular biosynthesis protein [Pandoraea faecigallinarum]
MKSRILVTGATGFIGRHIVNALAASDWATPVAASRRANHGMRAVDALSAASLSAALADVDGVVNCVAGSPDAIVANARALREALDARSTPIPAVHFSSMAVYGSAEGHVDESAALAGTSPYGIAKVEAEQALAGLSCVTVLRPGCVYGGGSPQWSGRIAELLCAGRLGDLGAAGDAHSNLVHVDDVVKAALGALRHPEAGGQAYNLAMADAPRWNDYFIAYAMALGATPVRRIGGRRLKIETKLVAPALKIAEILGRKIGLKGLPPPLPPSLARLWQQDICLDASRAATTFGLAWTPWRDAVKAEAARGSDRLSASPDAPPSSARGL